MKEWFEKLLKDLGAQIGLDIEIEEEKMASLIIDGSLIINLEIDSSQTRLLVICMLEELLPGKFRDLVLLKALQENKKEKKVAALGFSDKNIHLVLFQYFPEKVLNDKFLHEYLNKFIDIAFLWKKAINNNDLGSVTLEIKK